MRSRRKSRVLILAVLGLGGCLCAWGQDPPSPFATVSNGHPGTAPRRTMEGVTELRNLSLQLGLMPDQKEKLRPILTAQGDQLSVVRLDEHLPPDQKRAKSLEIRESFRPKIAAVLTPQQLDKWNKMQGPAPAQPPAQAQPPAAGQSTPTKPQ